MHVNSLFEQWAGSVNECNLLFFLFSVLMS